MVGTDGFSESKEAVVSFYVRTGIVIEDKIVFSGCTARDIGF